MIFVKDCHDSQFQSLKNMSYRSDCNKSDNVNSHWTSSDDESSSPKMFSEGCSGETNHKTDLNSDVELNATEDAEYNRKKSSLSGSDLDLSGASNIYSVSSRASEVIDEQNANELDGKSVKRAAG